MTDPTPRRFRRSRARHLGDAVISVFVRAGLIPNTQMLTTTGRRSGRPLTHPATIVRDGDRTWLVSPYGRAAGRVKLSRREYAVRELATTEAGPILKRYVAIASATRPYFAADRDAPVDDFTREAHRHPVFELLPADSGSDESNGEPRG
jgi:hypothetical protein